MSYTTVGTFIYFVRCGFIGTKNIAKLSNLGKEKTRRVLVLVLRCDSGDHFLSHNLGFFIYKVGIIVLLLRVLMMIKQGKSVKLQLAY